MHIGSFLRFELSDYEISCFDILTEKILKNTMKETFDINKIFEHNYENQRRM